MAILVHGHRGARALFPENTIRGFEYAIGIGADAIEMDVAATADNVLVLSHDPLKDCAGGDLPTLDEVLALGQGNAVQFNIEIKSYPEHPDAPPPAVFAKLVLEVIRRHDYDSRAIVQSFDFRVLREMKKLAPALRLGALWEGEPRSFVEIAQEAGASIVAPMYTLVTAAEVRAAHAAGLQVIPWTVNDPRDWDRLMQAGVDAIITDDPAALLKYHN